MAHLRICLHPFDFYLHYFGSIASSSVLPFHFFRNFCNHRLKHEINLEAITSLTILNELSMFGTMWSLIILYTTLNRLHLCSIVWLKTPYIHCSYFKLLLLWNKLWWDSCTFISAWIYSATIKWWFSSRFLWFSYVTDRIEVFILFLLILRFSIIVTVWWHPIIHIVKFNFRSFCCWSLIWTR